MHPTVAENTNVKADTSIERVARTFRAIKADSKGNLPTKIEILKVGMWDTPYHGMFMITPEDCQQMVDNFNAGVAMPGGSIKDGGVGLPIDFGHVSEEEAAGWIKEVEFDGMTLYASNVEWTEAGKAALLGGNYKCFSPEFYPSSRGGWEDPEQYDHYIPNVLVGGGLTNIPLFKGLKPIMASTSNKKDGEELGKNVIYVSDVKASNNEKENTMQLEQVRAKSADALTEEEKTFIVEHKGELTAEEQTKFGLEVAPAPATPAAPAANGGEENKDGEGADGEPVAEPEQVKELEPAVAASLKKAGYTVVKADRLKSLEDTAAEYRNEKAEVTIKAHIARGALKADQLNAWTGKLVKASTAERKELEGLLEKLPSHAVVASKENGANGENQGVTAHEQLTVKADAKVAASDGKLNFNEAYRMVRDENPELDKQLAEERAAK